MAKVEYRYKEETVNTEDVKFGEMMMYNGSLVMRIFNNQGDGFKMVRLKDGMTWTYPITPDNLNLIRIPKDAVVTLTQE